MAYTLPELSYDYAALEPHVDAETMRIHHDLHHAGYMNKLNAALEKYPEFFEKGIEDLMRNLDKIPEDVRGGVKNNGGGYFNHNLFWESMSPDGGAPEGELKDAIEKSFGSFDEMKEKFSNAAATQFGSGWAWLYKESDGSLGITNTSNQDIPFAEGRTLLMNLDVWEHSYYLKYQNKRPDYIENWWNVLNWKGVAEKFKS